MATFFGRCKPKLIKVNIMVLFVVTYNERNYNYVKVYGVFTGVIKAKEAIQVFINKERERMLNDQDCKPDEIEESLHYLSLDFEIHKTDDLDSDKDFR